MNLIDKLLLGLLVLLLPIGLAISLMVFPSNNSSAEVAGVQLDEENLKALIQETVQQNQPVQEKPQPISITQVRYASESGTLKLSGSAPSEIASVLVSATVIKPDSTENVIADDDEKSAVKGSSVETFSVLPETNRSFEFELLIDEEDANGVVELRLEQDESIKTVKFDLQKKKQIL